MTRKLTLLALLTALAAILFTVESLIGSPFPWMRLGLANIMTLLAVMWWGFREGMAVTLLRVLIGSLAAGKFMQPAFGLALVSGVVSTSVMAWVWRKSRLFSPVGVSVLGAVSHNTAQMLAAYLFYIRHIFLFTMLPFQLLTALAAGMLIGALAQCIDVRMKKTGIIQPSVS